MCHFVNCDRGKRKEIEGNEHSIENNCPISLHSISKDTFASLPFLYRSRGLNFWMHVYTQQSICAFCKPLAHLNIWIFHSQHNKRITTPPDAYPSMSIFFWSYNLFGVEMLWLKTTTQTKKSWKHFSSPSRSISSLSASRPRLLLTKSNYALFVPHPALTYANVCITKDRHAQHSSF